MRKLKEFVYQSKLLKRTLSAFLALTMVAGLFSSISLVADAAVQKPYYGDQPESDGYYYMPRHSDYMAMAETIAHHTDLYHLFADVSMVWAYPSVETVTTYNGGYSPANMVISGRTDMIDKWKLKDFDVALYFPKLSTYNLAYKERDVRMYLSWDYCSRGSTRKYSLNYGGEPTTQYIGDPNSFLKIKKYANAQTEAERKLVTITADINAMIKNIRAVCAEVDKPTIINWKLANRENDTPLLWLEFSEELRPVDYDVLNRQLLSEVINLELELTPINDPNAERTKVRATCVEFVGSDLGVNDNSGTGNGKLGFEILQEDWDALQASGNEWVIRKIVDKCTYDQYDIFFCWPIEGYVKHWRTGENYNAPLPITDLVGNPFKLRTIDNVNIRLDSQDPYISNLFIKGGSLPSATTKGVDLNGWEDTPELNWSDLFVGKEDSFSATLELNEKIQALTDDQVQDIYLEWSVKDESGYPLRTYLSYQKDAPYVNGNATISQLVFHPLLLSTVAAEETGKQVRPVKLHGAQYLQDLFNNAMSDDYGSEIDVTVMPDKQLYLDVQGPAVTLGQVIKGEMVDNAATYSVELTITDETNQEAGRYFAGMVGGDSKIMGSFSIYSRDDIPAIGYSYSLLPSEADFDGNYASSGTLSSEKAQSPSPLEITKEGTYILYLKLDRADGLEISDDSGAVLDFTLWDILNNTSYQTRELKSLELDNVAPTANAQGATSVQLGATNSAEFMATVTASDLNGIARIDYQWASEENMTQEVFGNQKTVTLDIPPKTVTDTGKVMDTLRIEVYDKYGNKTTLEPISFSADLSKYVPQAENSGDPYLPGNTNDILITAPISTEDGGTVDAYIRVEYTDASGVLHVGTGNIATDGTISLFGTNDLIWKVKDGDQYISSDAAFLQDIYGEAIFTIWAAAEDLTLTSGAADPAETSLTAQSMTISTTRTCLRYDVHSVTFGNMQMANGVSVREPGTHNELDYVYFVPDTFTGARYPFTIANTLVPDWTTVDVDWANSYAVMLKVNADGTVPATETEASARISLTAGINQSMVVPKTDAQGNPFTTGVYVWKIILAQKAGGSQEFLAPIRLLLDAVEPNAEFGVYEYTNKVSLANGSYGAYDASDPDTVDYTLDTIELTQSNEDGSPLQSIDVAVAAPYSGYGDFEIVKDANGRDAYALIPVNGGGSLSMDIWIDTQQLAGNIYMGEELGKLQGIRYWNADAPVDLDKLPFELTYTNEANHYAYLTINKRLEWYDEFSGRQIIVDDLSSLEPATSHKDFRLIKGRNRVAYQLKLSNGKMSDVMYVDLVLRTATPSVSVEFTPGAGRIHPIEQSDGTTFQQLHTTNVTASITNFTSVSDTLDFYQLTSEYYADRYVYALNKVTDPNNIVLTQGSHGYEGLPQQNGVEPDIKDYFLAVDAYGNGVAVFPIIGDEGDTEDTRFDTAIIEGFGKIGSLEIESAYDYDVNEKGRYKLIINHTYTNQYHENDDISRVMDGYSIQLDDGEPVYIIADGVEYIYNDEGYMIDYIDYNADVVDGPNAAGISAVERYGAVEFAFPYDPSVPLGQGLAHEITVRAYLDGKVTDEKTLKVSQYQAWNLRTVMIPSRTELGESVFESGFSDATDEQLANGEYYSSVRPADAYTKLADGDEFTNRHVVCTMAGGNYTLEYMDKFGNWHVQEMPINLPSDPKISVSTTEPTVGPVVVTVTSETYDLTVETVTSYNDPDYAEMAVPEGTQVEGNGTKELKNTLYNNSDQFQMTNPDDPTTWYQYRGIGIHYGDGESLCIFVDNIYNEPVKPVIRWSYLEQDVLETYKLDGQTYANVVFGTVEAFVVDENGTPLIDPTTGNIPTFTFEPGGVTSHTFSGYTNIAGVAGEDITATLPVTLLWHPNTSTSGEDTQIPDTWAPAVAINGYATYNADTQQIPAAYVTAPVRDVLSPIEETMSQWTASWTEAYGAGNVFDNTDALISRFGWADSYRLELNVLDESSTKVFITAYDNLSAPAYSGGKSDTVEGVSLIGRSVVVRENSSFIIHVVDEKDNATSIPVSVEDLGEEAPVPGYVQVLSKDSAQARVYLLDPNVYGVENLQITTGTFAPHPDAKVEDDQMSGFCGLPYLIFTENGNQTIYYSYELAGRKITGQITLQIERIDKTPLSLLTGYPKWSANYDSNATEQNVGLLWIRMTNQNITAQMSFNKAISEAYFTDVQGNPVTPAYASVSFLGTQATVEYSYNETALKLVCVNAANSEDTVIVDLPAVVTIDKSAPAVFGTNVSYSENYRSAVITLKVSEQAVLQSNGKYLTEVEDAYPYFTTSQTVKENGQYTFNLVDRAGNQVSETVTVAGIISEGLTLTVSTTASDAGIIDPATYIPNVGDVLYVKTNRDATVTVDHTLTETAAVANQWTAVTITESLSGLYPIIRAVDDYGNAAIVQMESVPLKDGNAPAVILRRSLIAIHLDSTDAEVEALLKANLLTSDETTPNDQLIYEFAYVRPLSSGKVGVTYTVTDNSGNAATCTGYIRFYSDSDLVVTVNGEVIERDNTVVVNQGELELGVKASGEPYKIQWKTGIKTVAQVKVNAQTITSYTDVSQVFEPDFSEAGYYTVVITTQAQDTYRIIVYVED